MKMFYRQHIAWGLLIVGCLQFTAVVSGQCLVQDTEQEAGEIDDSIDTEARALEITQELAARQLTIENIQSDLGVYDQSLVEIYNDLANFYVELEDYDNAVRYHSEALQITRINTGLYSHEQIPILDSLIQNNGRGERWEEVDNLQELYYFVNSRLFNYEDLRYLEAAEIYGNWKLRVVRENLLAQSGRELLNTAGELSLFYERVIEGVELQPAASREDLLAVIYGKSQIDLTLARSVARTPYTAFEGTENPYINQTRCSNVRNSQGQTVRQCFTVQVENPRYRLSQREAKQFALVRHTRQISRSIPKLEGIKNTSTKLSNAEKQQLEVQIAELVTESEQLVQASRRLF